MLAHVTAPRVKLGAPPTLKSPCPPEVALTRPANLDGGNIPRNWREVPTKKDRGDRTNDRALTTSDEPGEKTGNGCAHDNSSNFLG
ncbi:MAG: hypothetical protein A3H52_01130 [Candidatus Zambryskibacteria bacterium RIFCSPLOWO2_02_FULL_39_26]|uniref:Uncharacterized protein n=1 Tax=Candidatus Zambryskibacteria bacterium RIFCSPLOWO2_12_FULL_39_23 TaxID=1802776 RepID=A0A1G2USP4_9BACT|nr:MAG: hypothetical protein A3E59_01340 [Candidatus Zambryskibacteria bacterium RIFCSPHIGHO2_12_FULL_39_47]OHB10096.1 MAG: hypothetical protein A3H52_01130 [Candidatus Zambryskibacteria bacterium RIFCSPLOWO2_02_FULL_39_26]OHB12411.1 MAG: hypothetical protein A3G99_02400 [Candidatus Zambryskibacteria bacterium RIFCSPLOWO2_12_FULL_39_23]